MRAFADILAHIEAQYLVKHIMVPEAALVCGKDETSARDALDNHREYNVVPIKENGRLTACVERKSAHPHAIVLHKIDLHSNIVGDGTSILRLIDIFCDREFSFVWADNAISGYVHFSDLNHRLVNLALFALVSVYEYTLAKMLVQDIPDRNFQDFVTNNPSFLTAKQLKKVNDLQLRDAVLNWTTPLYFKEIVTLACKCKIIDLDEDQIKLLNDVRNRICHAPRLLVEKHKDKDVKRISEAKRLWLSYLNDNSVLRQA